jgi:hypothetical protein
VPLPLPSFSEIVLELTLVTNMPAPFRPRVFAVNVNPVLPKFPHWRLCLRSWTPAP